ncbi:hypothetical protein SKAU_G00162210 [Synaphobranchus kaupii]|uniref:Uncharacterized protein n=1 Tax=Synaphobranchus kaupii TaxID=118154 RepID=A0A9Q1FIV3_SYNKA|nr:hypothetical protein SKAU_G00162210 [Synaphobranchus kaupii]
MAWHDAARTWDGPEEAPPLPSICLSFHLHVSDQSQSTGHSGPSLSAHAVTWELRAALSAPIRCGAAASAPRDDCRSMAAVAGAGLFPRRRPPKRGAVMERAAFRTFTCPSSPELPAIYTSPSTLRNNHAKRFSD